MGKNLCWWWVRPVPGKRYNAGGSVVQMGEQTDVAPVFAAPVGKFALTVWVFMRVLGASSSDVSDKTLPEQIAAAFPGALDLIPPELLNPIPIDQVEALRSRLAPGLAGKGGGAGSSTLRDIDDEQMHTFATCPSESSTVSASFICRMTAPTTRATRRNEMILIIRWPEHSSRFPIFPGRLTACPVRTIKAFSGSTCSRSRCRRPSAHRSGRTSPGSSTRRS